MAAPEHVGDDGFYASGGLSATRRTVDGEQQDGAPDSGMRELLAAMPGAMKTAPAGGGGGGGGGDSGGGGGGFVKREPRFREMSDAERKAARAEAADARREEAVRLKRRAIEVKRQAESRYTPPVDGPCLGMTLVLVVLLGLWVADIYFEYVLQTSRDAAAQGEAGSDRPAGHDEV
jgi:hypothetical protein